MRRFASLRRREDFTRLRKGGRRIATANFTLFAAKSQASEARPLVGIAVSRRVGSAVVRNRTRRRIAAGLQEFLTPSAAAKLLVVPRPSAAGLAFGAIRDELEKALA